MVVFGLTCKIEEGLTRKDQLLVGRRLLKRNRSEVVTNRKKRECLFVFHIVKSFKWYLRCVQCVFCTPVLRRPAEWSVVDTELFEFKSQSRFNGERCTFPGTSSGPFGGFTAYTLNSCCSQIISLVFGRRVSVLDGCLYITQ